MSGWSGGWSFTTIVAAPAGPVLSMPVNSAAAQPLTLTLSWGSTAFAASYCVQVAAAADFSTTVSCQTGLTGTGAAVAGLSLNTVYYWRVGASNVGGVSPWSDSWSFTTIQKISLAVGSSWNLVSMNIKACDSSFACVLGSPNNFILAKDAFGNVYCPQWGVSGLSTFRTGAGYQVYSAKPDTFSASGAAINTASEPIALSKQWNMIGYLPASNQSIESELFSITPLIVIVKNNEGQVYWPDYGIDDIQTMVVGQGYQIYMQDSAVFTYGVSFYKQASGGKKMLSLPQPRHFGKHATTGNNASVLVRQVTMDGRPVADSSEIGAYDSRGNLVGAGMVIGGVAAFPVWGADQVIKLKNGCTAGEAIGFKLFTGGQEYPLEFRPASGGEGPSYAENALLLGSLSVAPAALIAQFDLAKAYPNPFSGSVRIAFDVPGSRDAAASDVTINVYDMKGALVQQIAKGKYPAGRYSVTWNDAQVRGGVPGPTVYIVRMKAANFDKRLKIIRVQ